MKRLVYLAILFCALPSFAAPAFVANATKCATASAVSTQGCSVTPALGETLVVWVTWGESGASAPTLSSCSGTGLSFTVIKQAPDNTNLDAMGVCVASNVPAGAVTVTATLSGNASSGFAIYPSRYSGLTTVTTTDGTPVSANSTGASASTGSVTTATNGDLILVGFLDTSASTRGFTQGTGFTSRFTDIAGGSIPGGFMSEDQVQGTAGAISGTATVSTGTDRYIGIAFALKASGGAAVTCTNSIALTGVGCR
jgi:hypothetical protein